MTVYHNLNMFKFSMFPVPQVDSFSYHQQFCQIPMGIIFILHFNYQKIFNLSVVKIPLLSFQSCGVGIEKDYRNEIHRHS